MLLTCPANKPHSAAQCASKEQPDCSDRQSAANSRLKSPHSPILLSQQNNTDSLQHSHKKKKHKIHNIHKFSFKQLVHYHLDINNINSQTRACTYLQRHMQLKVPLLRAYSSIFRHRPPADPLEDPSASSSKVLVSSFRLSSASLESLLPSRATSVSHAMLESTGQIIIGQVKRKLQKLQQNTVFVHFL